ncbi:MAG: WXG100 family type VII secretion target [Bacteroidaceae bacterium]|nr:WXG100 family type VII secretion target [Bacteroidaceae bacterium]
MAEKDAGVVSADELHHFANYLSEAESRLSELMGRTISELENVNQGWQDRKQAEFTEDFTQALDAIAQLADLMAEHSRYVHFKANQIEDYTNS